MRLKDVTPIRTTVCKGCGRLRKEGPSRCSICFPVPKAKAAAATGDAGGGDAA